MKDEQNKASLQEQIRQEREQKRRMRWERHAQRRMAHCRNMHHSNKSWVGIVVILIGVVWLLRVIGVAIPDWVFDWPMILVAMGLATGLASRFRNFGSIIMMFIGLIFMAHHFVSPDLNLEKYVWPVIIIFIGFLFIVKRRYWESKKEWMMENRDKWEDWHRQHHTGEDWGLHRRFGAQDPAGPPKQDQPNFGDRAETGTGFSGARPQGDSSKDNQMDWINTTTIFGGTKRRIISKNFKGGDVVNIFGGSEIDLTHSDISGTVILDIVNICGGVQIAVPSNWQVRTNTTHLFAGIDDRRRSDMQAQDSDKVLILTGTLLMSGLEILDVII